MKNTNCFATFCGITLVIFFSAVSAQPPDSLWSRTVGGISRDICYSVQQTEDGGFVLAGSTESFGNGWTDMWLVRMAGNGDSLWSRTYGGTIWDGCYSVEQTSEGGYILAGYTRSFGAGLNDVFLLKTDANGDSLWSRVFGGSSWDHCKTVHQTSDGGYILVGRTESFGAGSSDLWTIKTDSDGDVLWSRTFGTPYEDEGHSVQQTLDGGYVLAGRVWSSGLNDCDFWLIKLDANGDSLWSRTFGGVGYEECYSVQLTLDGGFVLAGRTESFGAGRADFWLIKTDANGEMIWNRTFGGWNCDWSFFVQQVVDGGYVLVGRTESFGAGNSDFWLVRTDSNGDSLWSRTFGGGNLEECYLIQQTLDGGYILGGRTESFGAGSVDFWLVKTGPELAAEPIAVSLPCQYALYPNWPNPFNPATQISYDLPKTSYVTLTIFDLLGREVGALVNGVQPAGTHHATFDGSHLPSGIYFCRLQVGDFVDAKKMVLLK